MKKEYPFPGEVTLSTDEYADLLLDLNKAQRDAQMYLDAFTATNKDYIELKAKYAELENKYSALVKETEDDF